MYWNSRVSKVCFYLDSLLLFFAIACSSETEGGEVLTARADSSAFRNHSMDSSSRSEGGNQYVGLQFSGDLPDGLVTGMGWLLEDESGVKYGLRLVEREATRMVWLSTLVGRDVRGRAKWHVVAVGHVPTWDEGQVFVPLTCRVGGVANDRVFAVVTDDGTELLRAAQAWQIDLTQHAFDTISHTTVQCVREVP